MFYNNDIGYSSSKGQKPFGNCFRCVLFFRHSGAPWRVPTRKVGAKVISFCEFAKKIGRKMHIFLGDVKKSQVGVS